MKKLYVAFILFTLLSCSSKHISDRLNGTWANKEMGFTVTINTKAKTYKGSVSGESFDQDFIVVKEENNIVTFTTMGQSVTAVINSEKDITITQQESGIPIALQKVEL
jgi:hypothetical protein